MGDKRYSITIGHMSKYQYHPELTDDERKTLYDGINEYHVHGWRGNKIPIPTFEVSAAAAYACGKHMRKLRNKDHSVFFDMIYEDGTVARTQIYRGKQSRSQVFNIINKMEQISGKRVDRVRKHRIDNCTNKVVVKEFSSRYYEG